MGPSIKQAQQVPNDQAKLVAWILGGQSGLPPLLYSLVLRSELKKKRLNCKSYRKRFSKVNVFVDVEMVFCYQNCSFLL